MYSDVGGWENLSKLIDRPPVAKILLDYSSTSVGSGSWVEIEDSLAASCTAVELFNGSGAILKIATGANGSEVEKDYYILPGGSSVVVPLSFSKGQRITLKTADGTTASTGFFAMNCLA
jgi:hypothetical protein